MSGSVTTATMTTPNTSTQALRFATELRANVDAWYAQPNTPATYAAFSARNGAIWNRIVASGDEVHQEVLRILRETR